MKYVKFISICICIGITLPLAAQFYISGQLLDENKLPIQGEVIQLLPQNLQATSDGNGNFIFENVKAGLYTIQINSEWWQINREISVDKNMDNLILQSKLILPVEEVVIKSVRFNQENTASQTTMSKSEIAETLGAADMPYVLQATPSLVVTSDAGAGVGYTSMRIRGTDQSRINVTINGIPLNDAESQNVFFVDLPDLAASAQSIQVQRGVGTSSHGAASFGASVNVNTHTLSNQPEVTVTGLLGSFNTKKGSVQFNTGKLGERFYLQGRISQITSDGYIDRATSDLRSVALSPTFLFNKSSLRYDLLYGKERTYQAWYGISQDDLENNRTFNPAGTEREPDPHPDQVDDYLQVHHQLHYNTALSDKVNLGLSAHYTPGKGFFEEYKADENRTDYGFPALILTNDTIDQTDLVRRRWLDNDFYGLVGSAEYNVDEKSNLIIGGGWNHYIGRHFGEVVWAEFAQGVRAEDRYYDNQADKYDGNVYIKYNRQFNDKLSAFADLQYRNINYKFRGPDQNGSLTDQEDQLNFFNPKFGLAYKLNDQISLFAHSGIAQKEPNRDDYTESSPLSRPKSEWLWDTELGAQWKTKNIVFNPNFYYMKYRDQLALNGAINDVGAATRINVDDSYRMGLELDLAWQVSTKFRIKGNATFSKNEVKRLDQFVDSYDANFSYLGQELVVLENTAIPYSPQSIGYLGADYTLFNSNDMQLNVFANIKHVGKQYLDLSGDENNILESYETIDAGLEFNVNNKIGKRLSLRLNANNILEERYAANAWSYKYFFDGQLTYDQGFYPQALRNYSVQLAVTF